MLIEKSRFQRDSLRGVTVLLTGGGGGIGYEAARALVWLGANVVIAELAAEKGMKAQADIDGQLGPGRAWFYEIDISDERAVTAMARAIAGHFGGVDVLFNNAAVTPMGAVGAVAVADWDRSYAVNLRAPVLLIRTFVPDMVGRGRGAVVFVPSSGAAPYMGAYEVMKTAQVELCNTLAGELEDTGVMTYAIGPGLVGTETARKAIEEVSSLMGLSTGEFYAMNQKQMLSAEEAGTGFALSVAMAQRYNGQEIGSIQALMDGGVYDCRQSDTPAEPGLPEADRAALSAVIDGIVTTYARQHDGWLDRNVFERQWVLRDFKKTTGMSADEMRAGLKALSEAVRRDGVPRSSAQAGLPEKLRRYYERQRHLLQGYERDPQKLRENTAVIDAWIDEIDRAETLGVPKP